MPSLTALRAFEAAGRHLNFTRAASELHVTQAAVSHQIRALEDDLGVALFRRLGRRLTLTAEGERLLPVLGEAFGRITEVAEGLRAGGAGGTLTVMLRPYFATKWLAPRLGRFWQAHPRIALRLQHSIRPVDFGREAVDLAVLWGRGDWPGVASTLMMAGELTPVCSPALLDGPRPLRAPSDLRHHVLLHEESHEHWTSWLDAAGARDVDPRGGTIIDDSNVRLEAAIDGQGVALGWVPLLADDLAAGRLTRPFDLALGEFAYYIVHPPGAPTQPKVKAFRDWLLDEVGRDRIERRNPTVL